MTTLVPDPRLEPHRTKAWLNEIPMPWIAGGCEEHPEGMELRLEVCWMAKNGKAYAYHFALCSVCHIPIASRRFDSDDDDDVQLA